MLKSFKTLNYLSFFFLLWYLNSAYALSVDKIYVLGDSISDGGVSETAVTSLAKEKSTVGDSSLINDECRFQGRYTNGLTTIEKAVANINLYNKATFKNYAVSGLDSIGLKQRINAGLIKNNEIGATNLVVILIGANDLAPKVLNGPLYGTINDFNADIDTSTTAVISNIDYVANNLISKGTRKFLLVGLPNFSRIPGLTDYANVNGAINQQFTEQYIKTFNNKLINKVNQLNTNLKSKYVNASANYFDFYTVSNLLLNAELSVNNLYDSKEQVYTRCNEIRNTSGIKGLDYYNSPLLDKDIFFDALHFSRRAAEYFGADLSRFIQLTYK